MNKYRGKERRERSVEYLEQKIVEAIKMTFLTTTKDIKKLKFMRGKRRKRRRDVVEQC